MSFSGPATFRWAVLLTLGSVLAFLGSLSALRSRRL
jgi:hypothetical protein